MIQASKSSSFDRLFGWYNEHYLLSRHFHTVSMRGAVDRGDAARPVLYLMNHSSWWDGLLVHHAVRQSSSKQHYAMMDSRNLSQYRFFRKLGAFSVDKDSSAGMARALRYASSLLNEGNAVWLFPQGDIQHLETRPLRFQGGAAHLLARCPQVIARPVTAYYSLSLHQKPDASLWFGDDIDADWSAIGRHAGTALLEEKLQTQLDAHRASVMDALEGMPAGFRPLTRTGRSTSEAFRGWKEGAKRWRSFFGR